MRMTRFDHAFTAYTLTQDASGYVNGKSILYASFNADIQPLSKSPARLVEFGLDSTSANSKILFHDTDRPLPKGTILMDGDTGLFYVVMASPVWQGHLESIIEPWNGALP